MIFVKLSSVSNSFDSLFFLSEEPNLNFTGDSGKKRASAADVSLHLSIFSMSALHIWSRQLIVASGAEADGFTEALRSLAENDSQAFEH